MLTHLFIAACFVWQVAAAQGVGDRSWEWPLATPESQGLSGAKLAVCRDTLALKQTKAFLVIRNDRIVYEWYAPGHSATNRHHTASLAKALVGGLSVAVALTDGRIGLDDPIGKYVPPWRVDPAKSKITFRQLGSHTSGIEDAEGQGLPHDRLTGWKGDFWKRLAAPRDPFTLARDEAPLIAAPGTEFHYSNPGIAMLAYAVTAALPAGPERDLRSLLRNRVMRPLGVPDAEWSVGYGQTVVVDGLSLVAAWGGGDYTARAVARVGLLMLHEGEWQGKRLLSAAAVRSTTRDVGTPHHAAIGWWSNGEGACEALPRDAFWGAGAGHQVLLVVPSLNVVVVRNGAAFGPPADFDEALYQHLFRPVSAALSRENRLPQ